MKIPTILLATTAALTFSVAAPAQESSYDFGNYWSVSTIHVEDGQFENYMDHLAGQYRTNLEYAKSQGWISDYHVLLNSFAREDEPDLVLISIFDEWVSNEEQERRQAVMEEYMSATTRELDTAYGGRLTMRRPGSDTLYQELELNTGE